MRPGGWAFQYANDYYPDVDDTAVVVMALDRLDRQKYREAIEREPEVVKEVTTSEKWLAEIHQDEELASVKAKVEEILAEREAWERRVSIRMVSLRLSGIYGGIFRSATMPAGNGWRKSTALW